ncbi:hypothetical protein EYF80_004167 [Liparis tanakae]|uniref:Uncharacterized protein n=1 Tax=Liparis tanakae TaxID=230148 RepID=A0A4Z2J6M0_9TELE|nr:hypothetical protein EYF80_004167 [Liparis tanakae]
MFFTGKCQRAPHVTPEQIGAIRVCENNARTETKHTGVSGSCIVLDSEYTESERSAEDVAYAHSASMSVHLKKGKRQFVVERTGGGPQQHMPGSLRQTGAVRLC